VKSLRAEMARVVGSRGVICSAERMGMGNGGGLVCAGGASGSSESSGDAVGAGGEGGRGSRIMSMLRVRTSTNWRPVIYARIAS
jgi:hypothetical protein